MKKNLADSNVLGMFTTFITSQGYQWEIEHSKLVIEILFKAIAQYLSVVKSKDKPKAISFKDEKGNFLLAAKVGFENAEDEEMPGNWYFEFTTKEEDIEDSEIIFNNDLYFESSYSKTAEKLYGMEILNPATYFLLTVNLLKIIFEYMTNTVVDNKNEAFELKCEDLVNITAVVNPDTTEVEISITPDAKLKQIIKTDSSIQANS